MEMGNAHKDKPKDAPNNMPRDIPNLIPNNVPQNGRLSLSRFGKCHVSVQILQRLGISTPGKAQYLLTDNALVLLSPRAKLTDTQKALSEILDFLNKFTPKGGP